MRADRVAAALDAWHEDRTWRNLRASKDWREAMSRALAAADAVARPEMVANEIRLFAGAILHGDAVHREWLIEAAEAFIAGQPVPPVFDTCHFPPGPSEGLGNGRT